ncbi:hypothetical protein HYW84_01485 [Candidatus Peregrinibacteria bacterium]|nr:hypothetical protein [Candidatus Peregrinibacteria bacterium]
MPPATPASEKQLRTRYLNLVDTANAAAAKGDTAARITAEREIASVGAEIDAIRSKRR